MYILRPKYWTRDTPLRLATTWRIVVTKIEVGVPRLRRQLKDYPHEQAAIPSDTFGNGTPGITIGEYLDLPWRAAESGTGPRQIELLDDLLAKEGFESYRVAERRAQATPGRHSFLILLAPKAPARAIALGRVLRPESAQPDRVTLGGYLGASTETLQRALGRRTLVNYHARLHQAVAAAAQQMDQFKLTQRAADPVRAALMEIHAAMDARAEQLACEASAGPEQSPNGSLSLSTPELSLQDTAGAARA